MRRSAVAVVALPVLAILTAFGQPHASRTESSQARFEVPPGESVLAFRLEQGRVDQLQLLLAGNNQVLRVRDISSCELDVRFPEDATPHDASEFLRSNPASAGSATVNIRVVNLSDRLQHLVVRASYEIISTTPPCGL